MFRMRLFRSFWSAGWVAGIVVLTCSALPAQTLEGAFVFGSRSLACQTPNEAGTNYDMVLQIDGNPSSIEYGIVGVNYGYEVLYDLAGISLPFPPHSARNGWEVYGPMDDSANNRAEFPDTCPEQIYDSFIGCKNFLATCDEALIGNRDDPCSPTIIPDGCIFRIDVPDGWYRFVAAVGEADNRHAHRILAENGGEGPPQEIGPNHVVLVANHDQAQFDIGQISGDDPGDAVFACVGFDDKVPPVGDGIAPDPAFVNMDENGRPTSCPPNSPALHVTEGYIRIHCLQANSNSGIGGARDSNGGDMVLLELWRHDAEPTVLPTPSLTQSFDVDVYQPGDTIEVQIDIQGVATSATIVATVPDGWTPSNPSAGGSVSGQTVTFNVAAEGQVKYSATAPDLCTGGVFTASAEIEGAACQPVASGAPLCDPGECGIQASGGVRHVLVIGPIAIAAPDTACNDNGAFETCDYITNADGSVSEANVLVEEGDDVTPDWTGGAACGLGIGAAPNLDLNPEGGDTLTVWKARADSSGWVDYNLPGHLDDPIFPVADGEILANYVIYSVSYLENTTGDCLEAMLEVGSDDGCKMLVNGRQVHAAAICRSQPGYGAGDMVPVILTPGTNIVVIAVVENTGNNGVRLVVRNPDGTPMTDGSVVGTCVPPAAYPVISDVVVTRAIDRLSITTPDAGIITVTLSASGVEGPTAIADIFPPEMEVQDAGGGSVAGNTITFSVSADGDSIYTLRLAGNPDECPFVSTTFSGKATPQGACATIIGGDASIGCITTCPDDPATSEELVEAFIFGTQPALLAGGSCPSYNDPGFYYTIVDQINNDPLSIAYPDEDIELAAGIVYPDEGRHYGYEIVYQDSAGAVVVDPDLDVSPYTPRGGGYEIYGPLDESANNRNDYPDTCPEQIYDSFIGGKNWLNQDGCNQSINEPPDGSVPCAEGNFTPLEPDGIIFRVDVPNGSYRFVMAVGDTDNVHAHRIVAE
ncbi:MAG: hypothetical protein JXA90_14660, partial [Planctomycetes bacterium]|nr:hypothetical protein [Planctomycetota bacterium]